MNTISKFWHSYKRNFFNTNISLKLKFQFPGIYVPICNFARLFVCFPSQQTFFFSWFTMDCYGLCFFILFSVTILCVLIFLPPFSPKEENIPNIESILLNNIIGVFIQKFIFIIKEIKNEFFFSFSGELKLF